MNTSYPFSKRSAHNIQAPNTRRKYLFTGSISYYQVDLGMWSKVFKNRDSVVVTVIDVFNSLEYAKIVNQRVNYLKETFYDPQTFLVY